MRQADESASAVAAAMESNVVSGRTEKAVARGGNEIVDEPREGGQESVVVERKGEYAAVCKWTIAQFAKVKARALWSKYFEVGGYDCRLLVYPKGDSQALPGYISIYLQVTDPRGTSSSKWDCFASYRLCVVNQRDDSKTIQRDSWHRFSGKKKSHGWCDFTPSAAVLDTKAGFMVNEAVLVTAEILVLHESVSFSRENELPLSVGPVGEVLSGKFTWKVHNLSLFKEMIKTQKIMSPVFPAGECNLRLSVYQSSVSGVDYLSMCLESKDTEKSAAPERSCWCLFRMSVLNQRTGGNHVHRDSYGRFAADNKSGDNTSLGWNDYMKMADFVSGDMGYLVDDTAVFSASFHVIKESSTFSKNIGPVGSRSSNAKKGDGYQGKFVWRIDNFTRLKDLLKKRKITGLCIKSRRFQVGNRDCRLIVYPRGQSQPPCHLSMFLEVTDQRCPATDWSCFVSHRLSVVNQRWDERSVSKESQNRYSRAAKDWGWREFVTLTSLFDQDSGFLVQDTVVFSAEVLILRETSTLLEHPDSSSVVATPSSTASVAPGPPAPVGPPGGGGEGGDPPVARTGKRGVFTWRVENFVAFKEIMETRKIFSKFFPAGGVELRIGVYESLDTLCIYLESDQAMSASPVSPGTAAGNERDPNFWVRYRIGVVNQKHSERTLWKEASICTKTWNNSVLQFMKVAELLDSEAGFLVRDAIVFVCEILDCCPWFEFSDLEENRGQALMSDEEQDALSTDPEELLDSDESESNVSGDEEDIFRSLLARAGFQLSYNDSPPLLLDPSQLQVTLREKLLMDAGAVAAFLAGLRVYLDDPAKVKRLLLPTQGLGGVGGTGQDMNGNGENEGNSPSLMNLLMGVKVLQQAIVDLLLDIMVECCQPPDGRRSSDAGPAGPETSSSVKSRNNDGAIPSGPPSAENRATGGGTVGPDFRKGGAVSSTMGSDNMGRGLGNSGIEQRLERGLHRPYDGQAVQSSDGASSSDGTVSLGGDMWRPDLSSGTSSQTSTVSGGGGSSSIPDGGAVSDGGARDVQIQSQKPKWPEQADELLGLIVESLRTLDGHHHLQTQAYLEPPLRRRPQSAQKISIVLAHAPRGLQGALLGLVPRLVDSTEHPQAAQVLLERLRQPEAEPSLRLPVLGALVQLDMGPDLWSDVLEETLAVLPLASDDALAAAASFVLKAASECQQLPRSAKAVRGRLQQLGPAVSPRVLHALRASVAAQVDVATALLRDIDADTEPCDTHFLASGMQIPMTNAGVPGLYESNGAAEGAVAELQLAAQQAALACWRVADADVLVEMLTTPSLRAEATAVFERAVARGAFGEQAIVMVLERRRQQRFNMEAHQSGASARHALYSGGPPAGSDAVRAMGNGGPGEVIQGSSPLGQGLGGPLQSAVEGIEEEDDFPAILGLAETLSLSEDVRVREFVGTLYAVMFKVYGDEGYRERMLRGLVGRATSSASGTPEGELGLDILAFLVQEEGVARPVLGLMREAAEVAVAERGAVWQQLRSTEDELQRLKAEKHLDHQRHTKEKSTLQHKLSEAEATVGRLKGDLRLEGEKATKERKESAERLREMENQLEWARSEREEEALRLTGEKKTLQERLRDAETQLNQLKSRKREELKKIMKEKNALAERLKSAESARKRFDEEMKRFTTETVTREEVRQSLEAEVRRLTLTVGQTEGGLREKEEQVMRCEAYIDGMEAKLHAHQDYIQTLEASLQEEMSRHAPLYGAGLELLSMAELDTLARIHDEGLRQVRTLQQQRQQAETRGTPLEASSGSRISPTTSIAAMYGQAPPLAVGMPPILANGVGVHGNGYLNGTVGPWYPPA